MKLEITKFSGNLIIYNIMNYIYQNRHILKILKKRHLFLKENINIIKFLYKIQINTELGLDNNYSENIVYNDKMHDYTNMLKIKENEYKELSIYISNFTKYLLKKKVKILRNNVKIIQILPLDIENKIMTYVDLTD